MSSSNIEESEDGRTTDNFYHPHEIATVQSSIYAEPHEQEIKTDEEENVDEVIASLKLARNPSLSSGASQSSASATLSPSSSSSSSSKPPASPLPSAPAKTEAQSLEVGSKAMAIGFSVVGVVLGFLYLLFSAFKDGQWGWFLVLLFSGSLSTFSFALLGVAYYAAGVAMRPPWYHPTTPAQGLTPLSLPEYWQGVCRDPKTDLGIDYEDVSFKSPVDKRGLSHITLRGIFFIIFLSLFFNLIFYHFF